MNISNDLILILLNDEAITKEAALGLFKKRASLVKEAVDAPGFITKVLSAAKRLAPDIALIGVLGGMAAGGSYIAHTASEKAMRQAQQESLQQILQANEKLQSNPALATTRFSDIVNIAPALTAHPHVISKLMDRTLETGLSINDINKLSAIQSQSIIGARAKPNLVGAFMSGAEIGAGIADRVVARKNEVTSATMNAIIADEKTKAQTVVDYERALRSVFMKKWLESQTALTGLLAKNSPAPSEGAPNE